MCVDSCERSDFFDMYNESLGLVNKVIRVPSYFIGKPYHLWE